MADPVETPAAPAGSPGAAGAAREEAARQLVGLAGMVAAVLVAVAAEKYATDPDAWRTAKMRAARVVERVTSHVGWQAERFAVACWRGHWKARDAYRAGCAG